MTPDNCHPPVGVTSPTLLDKVRSGDPEAWGRLSSVYRPWLLRIGLKMGFRIEDAEDTAQNALIKAHDKMNSFVRSKHGDFRGWLKTIARNDFIEGQRKRREDAIGGSDFRLQMEEVEDPGEVFDRLAETECREALMKGVMGFVRVNFTDRDWEIFLTGLDSTPAAEVTDRFGVSPANVYTIRSRVMACLRQNRDELLGGEEY
jgi:RNA polymerase sigma factor (sigma-70 family)